MGKNYRAKVEARSRKPSVTPPTPSPTVSQKIAPPMRDIERAPVRAQVASEHVPRVREEPVRSRQYQSTSRLPRHMRGVDPEAIEAISREVNKAYENMDTSMFSLGEEVVDPRPLGTAQRP